MEPAKTNKKGQKWTYKEINFGYKIPAMFISPSSCQRREQATYHKRNVKLPSFYSATQGETHCTVHLWRTKTEKDGKRWMDKNWPNQWTKSYKQAWTDKHRLIKSYKEEQGQTMGKDRKGTNNDIKETNKNEQERTKVEKGEKDCLESTRR